MVSLGFLASKLKNQQGQQLVISPSSSFPVLRFASGDPGGSNSGIEPQLSWVPKGPKG